MCAPVFPNVLPLKPAIYSLSRRMQNSVQHSAKLRQDWERPQTRWDVVEIQCKQEKERLEGNLQNSWGHHGCLPVPPGCLAFDQLSNPLSVGSFTTSPAFHLSGMRSVISLLSVDQLWVAVPTDSSSSPHSSIVISFPGTGNLLSHVAVEQGRIVSSSEDVNLKSGI